MTYKPVPDATKLAILRDLAAGRPPGDVAFDQDLDREVVLRVGSAHGYPDRTKLAWAADVLAGEAKDHGPTGEPRPAPPAAASPDRQPTLIERGRRSPRKATQRLAERAHDAMRRLAEALQADEHAARVKAEQDAEKARVLAEVRRLERQLAEARARLTGRPAAPGEAATAPAGTTRRSAAARHSAVRDAGLDPKIVRTWARETGVDCPAAGKVPGRVVQAYLAAHPTEGAAA